MLDIDAKLKEHWPIVLIVIVAAILRFWRLETLTTFGGDLGYDLEQIWQIVHGNLTLLGSPIGRTGDVTLYLGPLYYYLEIPFLLFSKFDPIGVAISIVLARLVTVLLIYLVTLKIFGKMPAIIAALIAAISPYWVSSLGPPSQPYIIPTITSLIILLLVGKPKRLFGFFIIGFLIGANAHLHYLGLVSLPALILYLIYARLGQIFKKMAAVAAGFVLATSPVILFEARNKFFLTNQFLKQLSSASQNNQTANFLSNLDNSFRFLANDSIGISGFAPLLIIILFLIVLLIIKNFPSSSKKIAYFLLSLVIINVLAATLYFGQAQPHYLAAAYPAIFIFVAVVIQSLSKIHKLLPIISLVIIIPLLISKNNFLLKSGYTMPEDLTQKDIKKIARLIVSDVGQDQFNITSTLDGDSRAGPYRYLVKTYGKPPLSAEQYDRGDHLYVITRDPHRTVAQSQLFEISSFQPSEVANVWYIKGDIKVIKLTKKPTPPLKVDKFVTIVNPVRSRDLWVDRSLDNLSYQISQIQKYNLPSSWLLQYDTLYDQELTQMIKTSPGLEIGALLEVSEKLATDAQVSYKIADGDYYRPDKVFLAGYSPDQRAKLIKTYFKKYQQVFGHFPQITGGWYIDSQSQQYLSKLKVTAALVVADQYDTDSLASWGKYFSMPFYPSKYSSLEPAQNQSDKIPIVNLQWAQRHPVYGYGKKIEDSRHSLQANDYINNGFDSSYFDNLLNIYLSQENTDFVQITIGLEAGQEAVRFSEEFARQISFVKELVDNKQVQAKTVGDFANWYHRRYPGISPSHFISAANNYWYMSPYFRLAVFWQNNHFKVKDLRYYQKTPTRDSLYHDDNAFLDRKVPATIDAVHLGNEIDLGPSFNLSIFENFDRLTLNLDNRQVLINLAGVNTTDFQIPVVKASPLTKFKVLVLLTKPKIPIINFLNLFKFSTIEGQTTLGVSIRKDRLLGLRGFNLGIHQFPPQTLTKFKTPAIFLENLKPWLN